MTDDNNNDRNIPHEHMTDPQYGYVVHGMFLLSKWLRENEPQESKYKIGDIVTLTIEGEITRVYKDCDGTPLYELDGNNGGWSEYSISKIEDTSND